MNLELNSELLGNNIRLFTAAQHRPVTDAVLLADFARVSSRDIVCDMCAGCGVVSAVIYSRGIAPQRLYAVEIDSTAVQLDFARVSSRDIVCDMCAGCGVVSAVIYSRGIAPQRLYAVEIDSTAVQLLEQFKRCNSIAGFLPINADLRELDRHLPANLLDCIIVNPPYFKEGSGYLPEGEVRTTARYEGT